MQEMEAVDVAIIGAGLTGIAAAAELRRACPDKTFVMLEMRDAVGGTWDLFRYPGIRSDSDMYTLGFGFRPWTDEKAIASGEAIRAYLQDTARELGLDARLRLGTRVTRAEWHSDTSSWTLTTASSGGTGRFRARHVYVATGYYDYEAGFDPELPAEDAFAGPVVHPQHWPEDLDYAGRKVAIIGSGATAITLLPAMAPAAAKVTMVQRSPAYVHIEDDADPEAEQLRAEVGPVEAFARIRLRNLRNQQAAYQQAREDPEAFKAQLFAAIEAIVGREVREKHFTPTYQPWDQRVCLVPNGDLFEAVRDGSAEVVTGRIAEVTKRGLRMEGGAVVEADIIVKATGLNVVMLGGAEVVVDGRPVRVGELFTYKGMALSGLPNLVYGFGFLNSSWTLRLELVNRFWTRVLRHLDEAGLASFTPTLRAGEETMAPAPYIAGVSSGYMARARDRMPAQGAHEPWINPQSYDETCRLLEEDLDDGVLRLV